MSVPEGLRHKGRMEVFVKAQFMASHTAKILSNKNVFSPDTDPEIIKRIKNCAYDIYAKAWTANIIHAETSAMNRAWRYGLQEESILLCDEMLAYIGIAKQVFHLKSKKTRYWAELITETKRLLQAWKESDVRRYQSWKAHASNGNSYKLIQRMDKFYQSLWEG